LAKVIAVAGTKGGTGKSTLSHLIAHGAGSLPKPIPAVVLTTDEDDDLLEGNRRYVVVDGRTPELLASQLEDLLYVEHLLIVIDGAAGRADLDEVIAKLADVLVVPFGPADHEVTRVNKNLATAPKGIALPNRWPAHQATRARANRLLERIPKERRFEFPFPAIPKLDGLFSATRYAELAYDIASPARGLVTEVLARGGIDAFDLALSREQVS